MSTHEPKTAIFLHIPKTAGTTLYGLIWRHYEGEELYTIDGFNHKPADFQNLAPESKARLRMVTGHINYGIHQYLPQPATYFTILRHPLSLVTSYYYFMRGEMIHPHHHLAKSMALPEFLHSRIDETMSNTQTRLLAGKANSGHYYECTSADLAEAQRNLRHAFSVVGLTEKFDETLLLLQAVFGWQNFYYARMNVTRNKPRREALPAETETAVLEANQLDLELYQFATELFSEQIQQYGPEFARDVQKFKRKNQQFYPFVYGYWHARRQTTLAFRRNRIRLRNFYGRVRNRLNF